MTKKREIERSESLELSKARCRRRLDEISVQLVKMNALLDCCELCSPIPPPTLYPAFSRNCPAPMAIRIGNDLLHAATFDSRKLPPVTAPSSIICSIPSIAPRIAYSFFHIFFYYSFNKLPVTTVQQRKSGSLYTA